LFEDSKETICIAFYPDTEVTLSKLTHEFFQKEKINISQQNINIIINKCNNDRAYLLNELKKISLLTLDKKNLSMSQIMKVVNLTENHSVNELVNTCLLKNKKKTINILNENNFGTEDSILILRTFLNKLKKFLKLANIYQENKNLEITIKNARPPIFWKEKEIVKQQLINWTPHKIQNLIFELNNVELQVKKFNSNSINIVSDFILNSFTEKTNN
jgi:DNA polymerase-3 subunit delta